MQRRGKVIATVDCDTLVSFQVKDADTFVVHNGGSSMATGTLVITW